MTLKNITEILEYEMPIYAEFISIGWMQNLLARHIANKVNRKIARWNKRQERKQYLISKNLIHHDT